MSRRSLSIGLFSIVALGAHALHPDQLPARAAACYAKDEPTFADALAAVRRALWAAGNSRLGRAVPASAAALPPGAAEAPDAATHLGLRATLAPMRTRGVLWAAHRVGSRCAVRRGGAAGGGGHGVDHQLEGDVAACCTCAVAVRGAPGAYRATIVVRNISPFATEVVLNAVALGA